MAGRLFHGAEHSAASPPYVYIQIEKSVCMHQPLWAITSYFNPAGYQRRLANYRTFRQRLSAPLITVEHSFDGTFELQAGDADILLQVEGGSVLWQKERLLNLALKSLPAEAVDVAWIDCDVVFEDAAWKEKTQSMLQSCAIIQLFSDMIDLPAHIEDPLADCVIASKPRGIVSLAAEPQLAAFDVAERAGKRPVMRGLAWAAKKDLLIRHGFYDAMICGSGDRAMAFALYGRYQEVMDSLYANEMQRGHFLRWAKPFHDAVAGRVGCLPGSVRHLWHGDITHRGWASRYRMLAEFNFNPDEDIRTSASGVWELTARQDDLAQRLLQYFISRREDG